MCKQNFTYCQRSTSNLVRHVKTKHPIEFETEEESNKRKLQVSRREESTLAITDSTATTSTAPQVQPTLQQTVERTAKYKPDSVRKRQLDEHILDLILLDMQPLSVVEQKGFRKLINALDPKYEIISRKRLTSQLLPSRYQEEKDKLICELKAVNDVAVTSDCWTSRSNEAYTTITAHYITSQWELKSSVLLTRSEGKRHTVENLAAELRDAFQEVGIERKVSTVVTDNARNIVNAVEVLMIRHHACFAHTLNLMVRSSISEVEEIKSLVKKIKSIVTYFHSSTGATNSLREVHERRGSKMKKLKQDEETRWNSTFDMIRSYVDQHEEVTTVLCLAGKSSLCLDAADIPAAKDAMSFLEPFYEATTELSAEKNTSASKIIPLVKILSKITAKNTSSLSKKLHELLHIRFGDVEDRTHLKLSTLLDPRFRQSGFLSTERAAKAVEELKGAVESVVLPCDHSKQAEELSTAPPAPKKPSLLWSDFDEEIETSQRTAATTLTAAEMEVKQYLESQGLARDKDPLIWWREHAKVLPRLQVIAKDVLAIPATSVPSERIFSKAGELISLRRSNLKKKNVDMIIFLNKING
ncbi:zinc finger BED domain-containing protein 4-like [Aplysia californica]|uniref:Zinc finger BED domain-containing protein 4-like n=1 Tax=Aplysia californica TaxID=6500 RepID=A0ABM0JUK0_APLCA|nr:zinc finger BED domain-containing protein 4-like [Aplysia californica]